MSDKYESEFMGGDDAVYREKHISRLFTALLTIPGLLTGVSGIALAVQGEFAGAAAMAAATVATLSAGLFFAAMRIIVTPSELRVQYGTLGPTIPLENITSVEVVVLDAMTRLAVGPKIWPDGWRYVFPGARAGVRVTYRQGQRTRSCVIASEDPASLAAAIGSASTTVGSELQVRVQEHGEQERVEAEMDETSSEREESQ